MRIFQNFYFALFLLVVVVSLPAWAVTFNEVQIRQINPEGPVHTAMCSSEYETCYLTLVIAPENDAENKDDEYINVIMRFADKSIYFYFMREMEYLYTLT